MVLNKRFPGYKDDWIKIALSLLESDSTQKMLSSAILLIGACYKKCFNVPCNFFKKVIGQQNILIWIRSTAKKCTFGRCKNLYYFSYLSSHRKHEWAPLNSPAMAGKQNNNVKGENHTRFWPPKFVLTKLQNSTLGWADSWFDSKLK